MVKKIKLTNAEKSILRQLEIDSRMPFTQIAKHCRMSQQRVSYITSSLMKKGVIKNFYTFIDYSKLNVINFRVYFEVSYVSDSKLKELINYLISESHTALIATCGGHYDLLCSFFTLNPSQFNKTLRFIMEKFPQQLQNYTVVTTVVRRHFGRKYFLKELLYQNYSLAVIENPRNLMKQT